jgi:deoxyribodipyrimidine photo-lyase
MDYELSSNVGGWQWSASTGTDAQPYFRIFNPYLQSEKFDQNGEYIKKYVEELKYCDTKHIHKPTKQIIDYYKYYPPIVDHYEQREKAIAIFKKLKND